MENDIVEIASLRGSVTSARHPTPDIIAQNCKRARDEDSAHGADRYKRVRGDMQPKLETPNSEAASAEVHSWSPPRISAKPAHSAVKELSLTIDSVQAEGPSRGLCGVDVPKNAKCSEHDDTGDASRDVPPPHETRMEKRDRLMRQLSIAAGPEDMTLALETIQPRHYHTRDTIQAAPTNEAKLEILRLHRHYLVEISIQQLYQSGCVGFQCAIADAKSAATMSRGLSSIDRSCKDPTAGAMAWACRKRRGVSSPNSAIN